jgi:hypothetical protein
LQLSGTASGTENSGPTSAAARGVGWLWVAAAAGILSLLIVALVLLPGWIPLLPRAVVRRMTEFFLRGVLLAYSALLLAGLIGAPVTAWLLSRWSRRLRRSVESVRFFLLCFSCLVSLAMLEIGSAGWRRWMHRLPVLPASFPDKLPGEYRIVVLGGSSAMGEPFRPWLSVGQIVTWQLQRAVPKRRFELETLAFLGDSLEQQHKKLSTITKRPDAVIIYSGHNEFTARFEENRDYYLAEEPRLRLLQSAYRVSLYSPCCRLVYELVSKNRLDSPPLMNGRHQLIDPPLCSPSETAEVLADFTARLEALVGYCERIGALPILIVPPANEADYEPSRSTLPPTVSEMERDRLLREFFEARGVEATNPALGQWLYGGILDRHPDFAEAHFHLGRLLKRAGLTNEASFHFSKALENDGLPNRCKQAFREAYHQAASRHPGCIVIDGRKELMAASPTGLLDDQLVEDTHHPNLKGQLVLAGSVLRELRDRKTFAESPRFSLPLDPLECCDHFQMDEARLATACERTSVHFLRVSGYRYDPAERMEKSRRFAQAAHKLRAGSPRDELGLPGLDLRRVAGISRISDDP